MRLSIEPEVVSGNDVLTLKDVSKSFGSKPLFEGLSADIFREERVALIGPNGTGKTTLLKIICKKISNNGGTITLGAGVSIGYYDQAQDNLDDSKTIFDEISDAYPDLNNTKIRNTLAAFLFYGEDVFRPISSLSCLLYTSHLHIMDILNTAHLTCKLMPSPRTRSHQWHRSSFLKS